MRSLACAGVLVASLSVGVTLAESEGNALSLLRALGTGPGETTVRMEVVGRVAYRRQDLLIKMTFQNKSPAEYHFGPEAFAVGSFSLENEKGRPPRRAKAADDEAGAGEASVLPGYGTLERTIDLSAWFPRLTSKEATWSISWAHGDWSAGPLRAAVIRPHDPGKDDTAVVETEVGTMTWELLPDVAPLHVKNFVDLVRAGFYDGRVLHRVVPGILVEGGDAAGDGSSGWETLLPPEISPDLDIGLGMIGASRKQTSMTSDTLFFMTLSAAPYMKGKQTIFARLVSGYEVFAGIRERTNESKPRLGDPERLARPVRIERVRIK